MPRMAKTRSTPARATGARKPRASASKATPKLGKAELQALVERLSRGNTNLRARNRASKEAAKTAEARIAELEEQLARLEKELAAAAPQPPRRRPRHREIDPGDAVPPGVAVEEPAPPDLEAETIRENLEKHLTGE
jgi:hypothetical protein